MPELPFEQIFYNFGGGGQLSMMVGVVITKVVERLGRVLGWEVVLPPSWITRGAKLIRYLQLTGS